MNGNLTEIDRIADQALVDFLIVTEQEGIPREVMRTAVFRFVRDVIGEAETTKDQQQ